MTDNTEFHEKLMRQCNQFAGRMRQIPRKAVRCELYGTVHAVVDAKHVVNIFRKVVNPLVNPNIAYEAINILQDRLDERASIPGA